jgi:hypothetical protein
MLTSLSTPRSEKGQGLLIVVLFLLFIAMIVIVVSSVVHSGQMQGQFKADVSYLTDSVNGRSANDVVDGHQNCDRSMDPSQASQSGASDHGCTEYIRMSQREISEALLVSSTART